MSFQYNPVQPIATASSVASAPVNSGLGQIAGALNQHVQGTAYGHALTAGVGGISVASPIQGTTAAATGATDLWTAIDRLANAIGLLVGSSSVGGTWASLGGIVAGGGVGQATALATGNAIARRDVSGGIAFGPLSGTNIIGTAADSTHAGVYARGASGDPTQVIFAVQNNAGSASKFTADNLGNTVATGRITGNADMVIGTVIYAGSAATQVTDSVGLVRLAALPIVDGAHGGMGVDVTVSGNKPTARALLGAAASGSNGDITALTGITTAISPAIGGTGLINPAAGSIPVTNGSGNWLLLPPTPANYFVVSNGTTYVAQAFQTSMIPNGALNQSVMSGLFPTPGVGAGNLLKVSANAWQGYIAGTWVQFAGGVGAYSPAIDPTGIGVGQSRIDLLVLNQAGNLQWSQGTPGATPSIAATPIPINTNPIWYAKVYQGATAITGYADTGSGAALIADARNQFGPISSVTGTTGNTTATYATIGNEVAGLPNSVRIGLKPFLVVGGDTNITGAVDPFALYGAGLSGVVNGHDLSKAWINASRLYTEDPATVANAPNVDSLLISAAGGMELHPRNYIQFSGNTVYLNPCTVMFPNGKMKVNLTQKSHTIGPPGGYSSWYIVGDCTSTVDGTFDIQVLSALPALTPTQRLFAIALNNGSGFSGDPYVGWEPMLDVTSTQMRPITESFAANVAQTVGAAGVTTPNTEITAATKVLKFPRNMKLQVTGYARIYCATTAYGQVQATIDGIPLGMPSLFGLGFSASFDVTCPVGGSYGNSSDNLSLGPGAHTLRIMVQPYNNGNIVIAEFVSWDSTQWGV